MRGDRSLRIDILQYVRGDDNQIARRVVELHEVLDHRNDGCSDVDQPRSESLRSLASVGRIPDTQGGSQQQNTAAVRQGCPKENLTSIVQRSAADHEVRYALNRADASYDGPGRGN